MARSNEYHFASEWRLRASAGEVWDILAEPLDLPIWWPAVQLDVRQTDPGDPLGLHRAFDLVSKGWLPYRMDWRIEVVEALRPTSLVVEARGEFVGRGVWSIREQGDLAGVAYDWRLRAEKPLVRSLSFLLRPVFAANHRWAMERGRESLELELRRRRATSPEEAARLPAPPGPTFASGRRVPRLPPYPRDRRDRAPVLQAAVFRGSGAPDASLGVEP